jgi:RNA polymerase sigma-70 factor (ECF subfamily)
MSKGQREFAELILPLLRTLHTRATYLEKSPAAAEDLVQDTVERALRNWHRFRPGSNVTAWLQTVMAHIFIDRHRRYSRERPLSRALLDLPAPDVDAPKWWEAISDEEVWAAASELDPEHRSLLVRFLSGRWSYRELSAEFGIPEGTVGARLWRARRKVRTLLEARLASRPRDSNSRSSAA